MFKKTKVPHTYVIVFSIILIAALLTWIIPPGKYLEVTRLVEGQEKTELVFQYKSQMPDAVSSEFKSSPQTWQVFAALFKGFVKQSNIIIFILMIGGAFWIMNQSKAIDVGILSFLKFTKKLEHNRIMKKLGVDNIIMLLIMTMFSFFGAVFGMSEETIAFTIILIPLAISMGYDSIVGVGLVYVSAHLGFAGAILNPFTIGIAQGLAEIPLFSGIEYRIFCWAVINAVGFYFILRYASKLKKDPTKSIMYEEDAYWRSRDQLHNEKVVYYTPVMAWFVYAFILFALIIFSYLHPETVMTIGNSSFSFWVMPASTILFALSGYLSLRKSVHFFILLLLTYTIIFLIVGVMGYGWYVMEIATLFMALGIASGMAINKSADEIAKLFLEGVKDILSAAVIVGLAGGIIVILEDGGIIDSILFILSKAMVNFGEVASIGVMYLIQTIINVVIPSGSAKAAITMPIMAPFSDLINVSRQATVMAFQFGDGFTNMITPTSGVLIAVLGVARIPYQKWVKWVWPLVLMMIILGFLLLIPTVTMKLNGF
ncbi:MAG: AbgT family transporter [Bacteroidales bacterium]|nr:AbgT family transporter [Bacteroidales bacterium]MDP2236842.1 AbgT family transporter [Bacteroidales bacterium]